MKNIESVQKRKIFTTKMKAYRQSACLFILTFMFIEVINIVSCTEYYQDNGIHQTILINHKNKRKEAEVKQEILTLLGLHQRPKVVKHGFESSAPQFMISLYKSLETEDTEGISDDVVFNTKINLTLGKAVEHINGTDVVRSFINHGKFYNKQQNCPIISAIGFKQTGPQYPRV